MIARLAAWLVGRSRRERVLLALLALVGLPAAVWLALFEPLLERREAARAALAAAEDQRAWILARRAEMAALPPAPGSRDGSGRPPEGLAALEARLAAAGLDPMGTAQLADAGEGAVTLRLGGVAFVELMAWLETLEAETGWRLVAATLVAAETPGSVEADLRLEAGP